jgi:hypothetical protein
MALQLPITETISVKIEIEHSVSTITLMKRNGKKVFQIV